MPPRTRLTAPSASTRAARLRPRRARRKAHTRAWHKTPTPASAHVRVRLARPLRLSSSPPHAPPPRPCRSREPVRSSALPEQQHILSDTLFFCRCFRHCAYFAGASCTATAQATDLKTKRHRQKRCLDDSPTKCPHFAAVLCGGPGDSLRFYPLRALTS